MLCFIFSAFATDFEDTRYLTIPIRDTDGKLVRSAAVISAFKKIHPCPSTGLTSGACPNWSLNHIISLACGGIDEVSNLMWIRVEYKTGYKILPIDENGNKRPTAHMGYIDENGVFIDMMKYAPDRVELKIWALNPPVQDTNKCVNEIIE